MTVLRRIAEHQPSLTGENDSSDTTDIYALISLDLTNSTQFKSEQPILWKKVIASFYDVVFEFYGINQYQSSLKNLPMQINIKFWKFVGDEVLLSTNVYNCQEIYDLVKSTDESIKKIMRQIALKIASNYNCPNMEGCSVSDEKCDCPFCNENLQACNIEKILKGSLGVKATLWLAMCGMNETSRNIIHPTPSATNELFSNKTFDFLGPEIDEGFRIAKYAVKNRIVISPFLANALYLSSEDTDFQTIIEQNFKIVSYQKLKGIWNGRSFPIVMYLPSCKDIHDYLEYDELELPTYSEIKASGLNNARCKVAFLKKILRDIHLENESDEIVRRLKDENYKRVDKKLTSLPPEVHVACAVFNEKGALLVHKHNKRGWEFGCIHITSDDNEWKTTIQVGYKSKYSLNIDVPNEPIPIATYLYQKTENVTALGIMVLGKCLPCSEKTDFTPMTIQEIDELRGKMVDSFKENAKKAFEIYNISEGR